MGGVEEFTLRIFRGFRGPKIYQGWAHAGAFSKLEVLRFSRASGLQVAHAKKRFLRCSPLLAGLFVRLGA